MILPGWLPRYIGLPFQDGGRDFRGVDCWGLVRLVLRHEADIEVPSYAEIGARELLAIARAMRDDRRDWIEVIPGTARVFDVVLMRSQGSTPVHCGVALSSDRLLHIEQGTDSVHVAFSHPRIRDRVASVHRHRSLLA